MSNVDRPIKDDESPMDDSVKHLQSTSQHLAASSGLPSLKGEKQLGLPFTPQMRKQTSSIRMVDITPKPTLDEASCQKMLTTYQVYTIRKVLPVKPGEKATWTRSEIIKDPLLEGDIIASLKWLNNDDFQTARTMKDKMATLDHFQHGQVTQLVDQLLNDDEGPRFGWTIAQLDRKESHAAHGKYEAKILIVYVKRAPLEGINPIPLYQAWEKEGERDIMPRSISPPSRPPSSPSTSQAASSISVIKPSRQPRLSKALRQARPLNVTINSTLPLEGPSHVESGSLSDADCIDIDTPPSSLDGYSLSTFNERRQPKLLTD